MYMYLVPTLVFYNSIYYTVTCNMNQHLVFCDEQYYLILLCNMNQHLVFCDEQYYLILLLCGCM